MYLFLLLACSPGRSVWTTVDMRDGVGLATDVYLPDGPGPFPAVLVRTPYGRQGAVVVVEALGRAGVAVVAQDTRGRFDSEGVDGVFTTDADDGYDTLQWIVDQRWSTGRVGMLGDSAEGIVQYLAASSAPPGLAVMDVGIATPSVYSDAMFVGGVRRYALSHNWLEEQGSLFFEANLDEHPFEDAFWDRVQSLDRVADVAVPAIHTGGWFDIFQGGTLAAFAAYQREGGEGARGNQKLIMGPWEHQGVWGTEQGELSFPDNATDLPSGSVLDAMFDHWLQIGHPDIDRGPDDVPAVQYYVMGDVDDPAAPGNEWRAADDWPPPAAPVRLHLQAGGGLSEACPGPSDPTAYTFDPDDPAPTVCGANLTIPAGPCDQRDVESRDDVVVFDTPALVDPIEITGALSAHLFVDLDRPDTDLVVKLSDVYPDGRSMLMAEGALRLATRGSTTGLDPLVPGELVEAVVDLQGLSLIVAPGHRVRVAITSSSWPRYAVNRNNGLPYPASVDGDGAPVRVRVHHDEHASYVVLPDPGRDPADVRRCD